MLLFFSFLFRQLYLNYTYRLHEREFYFLVVLTTRLSEPDLRQSVGKICHVALRKRVINVVVLVQQYSGVIALYAYRLFREHCEPGIHAYQSNRFLANGELLHPQLFPTRFTNLSHCALNVTGHQLPPHFMYRAADGAALPEEGALIDMQDLRGIDGELLSLLARALRFRIHLKIPMEKSEIFTADTMNGCFAQVSPQLLQVRLMKNTLSVREAMPLTHSWEWIAAILLGLENVRWRKWNTNYCTF